MSEVRRFLRPDVVVEPLYNRWHATPQLLSPVTAPMYVANDHLRLMQSFVANPQIHVSALQNPAMRGGPFIDHPVARAAEIRRLMEHTEDRQAPLLQFARAIKTLRQLLQKRAQGASLEPLYAEVPEVLRGYVELGYDLEHRASFRFVESLLYESLFHDLAAQGVMLQIAEPDDRPFVASTPRLDTPDSLFVATPFANPTLDELFEMRTTPRNVTDMARALAVPEKDWPRFDFMFTDEPPATPATVRPGGVRARYFGHACVLLETPESSILVDPFVSAPRAEGMSRFSLADLPDRIDYVLITHMHQDHCALETLLELRHRIDVVVVPRSAGGTLVDPSFRNLMRGVGFARVEELDELQQLSVPGGSIRAIPFLGEHGDLQIRSKTGYLITLDSTRTMLMADSNNIEPRLYEHIHRMVGDIDVLFIGMECEGAPMNWLYGPLFTRSLSNKHTKTRRLDGSDCARALGLVERFNPGHVLIYALGLEPWLNHVIPVQWDQDSRPIVESERLVETCLGAGRSASRLYGRFELDIASRAGDGA